MKLAVSGKGGVGKSTISAALALLLAKRGRKVLAVDADPAESLASALGYPPEDAARIVPISRQMKLIEERTGAKVKQYGQVFQLNPQVDDIVPKFATVRNGVALLVLGAVEGGGSGCACPESTLLRALVTDLVLYRDDALILDMEAGIEHLGRGTARGVDVMLVVAEPSARSVETARRVERLSGEIGLGNVRFVGNKSSSAADEAFLRSSFEPEKLLGVLPHSESLKLAERSGRSVLEGMESVLVTRFERLLDRLLETSPGSGKGAS